MSLQDSEIIDLLLSKRSTDQNKAFVYLYNSLYDQFLNYVLKRGGQKFEVEDLLQEGLVVLYKLVVQGKLVEVKDIKSYLFTVCKNLWFRSKRKNKETAEIDDSIRSIGEEPTVMNHLLDEERQNVIQVLLQKLGESCQRILVMFYYEGLSMKEILAKVHFKTENALKNKKAKCMKALRELVNDNPNLRKNLR